MGPRGRAAGAAGNGGRAPVQGGVLARDRRVAGRRSPARSAGDQRQPPTGQEDTPVSMLNQAALGTHAVIEAVTAKPTPTAPASVDVSSLLLAALISGAVIAAVIGALV